MISYSEINEAYGNLDIYLLDQILKGRFDHCLNILDAGCGEGRNLKYFINDNRVVVGVDQDPMAIKMAQMTYRQVDPASFMVADLLEIPLPDAVFDLVISSAVLHFASDRNDFIQMFGELIRVLKPGGLLFIRMATAKASPVPDHPVYKYQLTEEDITWISQSTEFLEPFKTVVVEDRSMGFLMLRKFE